MQAYSIEIADSDYPYLVIASDVKEAVTKLEAKIKENNKARCLDIIRLRKQEYSDFQIVL
jgi:hypothetical protein